VKALLIGDIHLADRPPSIRTETYTDDILDKLQAAIGLAHEHGCDAIVSAGDVFHIKTPTRNSHALVQRTGDLLRSSNLPVLIVPGNHDLTNDRLDSLRRQPLGTLAKMEGIDLLIGPSFEFPLFGLPYLHDFANDLPRWMKTYREWADAQKADNFDFWPLMVTHAPLFPVGETPPYEYIAADDWAGLMEKGDCYYGHIHDPHGDYQPDPSVPVRMCNNGAISRGSLHEATLKREPAVTVWDSTAKPEQRFTRLPLPFRPAEAVFRLKEKEDVDERNNRVGEFLESVGSTRLDGLSLEEVREQARTRGLEPRTLTLIEELLETVS
jgi:DNA repair exonuclease SbcCD nuclease subunit